MEGQGKRKIHMRKRILALLCGAALVLCNTEVAVYASENGVGTALKSTEIVGTNTGNPENVEGTEIAESAGGAESTKDAESTEDIQSTEGTEVIEETEAQEITKSAKMDTEILEIETTELEEDTDAVVDGDPQSGISMSNIEEEPWTPNLYSIYQNSGYTGNTYAHNSRFDTGYTIVNGIDVSSHNGSIDWGAVKASGIDYAIIRAGYRTMQSGTLGEDTNFRANIQGALNAKLKVGVYIFSQATNQNEAVEEANYILGKIAGYNISLPVVIDFEYGPNNTGRLADANLDIDTATAVCAAFCNTVKSAGYTPMIYANKYMLESRVRGDVLGQHYKIWLANYTTQTSYTGEYYVWQYSSAGAVGGVAGRVDCNFFYEKNNYENAQKYVTNLYRNLLEREPDQSGLSIYANAIANGTMTAADVAVTLIDSQEFINKNYSDSTYITKLYLALLQRNPGSSETSYWMDVMSGGVTRRYPLINIVGSAEFATICNIYTIEQGAVAAKENRDKNYAITAYVARCYEKILKRPADANGLNTWSGKLLDGTCGGAEIVKDLVVSSEFTNKNCPAGEYVEIIYQAMLGRGADPSGKQNWLGQLGEGVSYVYIINGFSGSAEFRDICSSYGIQPGTATITEARDKNIGVTGFVNRQYTKVLERGGDAPGLNNWSNIILNKELSPKNVAHGFVFSQESINKNRNNGEYVEMLYNAFLDRPSDPAGKSNWVSLLDQGASREEVFWGFANSPEFERIIVSYGL